MIKKLLFSGLVAIVASNVLAEVDEPLWFHFSLAYSAQVSIIYGTFHYSIPASRAS